MKTPPIVHDDRWLPIVQRAMETLSGYGLPKPAGMEDERGAVAGYALHSRLTKDGRTCYRLTFRRRDGRNVQIGYWFVEPSGWVDGKIGRGTKGRYARFDNAPAGSTIERRDDGRVFLWYPRGERVLVKLVMPTTCPTCGRAMEQS